MLMMWQVWIQYSVFVSSFHQIACIYDNDNLLLWILIFIDINNIKCQLDIDVINILRRYQYLLMESRCIVLERKHNHGSKKEDSTDEVQSKSTAAQMKDMAKGSF